MTWIASDREATREDLKLEIGEGWHKLVDELIDDLFALGWNGRIGQIKEKYGGLRFYIGHGNESIFNRIDEAEEESLRTCERCGSEGENRQLYGWWITLCNACTQARMDNHSQSSRTVESEM